MRNKKNYPQIIIKYSSYLELCTEILYAPVTYNHSPLLPRNSKDLLFIQQVSAIIHALWGQFVKPLLFDPVVCYVVPPLLFCINPVALRKAKIVYNFRLFECSRVKDKTSAFAWHYRDNSIVRHNSVPLLSLTLAWGWMGRGTKPGSLEKYVSIIY